MLQLLKLLKLGRGLGGVCSPLLLIRDVLLVEGARCLVAILLHVRQNVVLV